MRIALAATLFTFISFSVSAQGYAPQGATEPAAKFDQYPSFIEMTSKLADNTQVVLRCGYVQTGNNITADAGFMEMTFLNPGNGNYLRYQRIDNKIIMTSPSPGAANHFVLEVVEPNGNAVAKTCEANPALDTIANCIANRPFMTPQEAMQQDQNAAQQCGEFLGKATPQLDRVSYSLAKTEVFKNTLRQKVQVLEGP